MSNGLTPDEQGLTPDEQNENSPEIPCPFCNEMVRTGLVRCWNCGTFMREDIADAYRKMQENPSPMIYSKLPEDAEGANTDPQYSTATMAAASGRDDDDFELDKSIAVTEYQASDDDFQLTGDSEESHQEQATIPLAREQSSNEAGEESSEDSKQTSATPEKPAEAVKSGPSQAESEEDHSVATGGDVLFNVAREEEKEEKLRRKGSGRKRRRRAGKIEGGVVVYCPNGHRIRVREEYRGAAGKCPACNVIYVVPLASEKDVEEPNADEVAENGEENSNLFDAGPYSSWFRDVKLHAIDPTKLKLKPNSLEKVFTVRDVAISPEKMLLLGLVKPGLMGGGSKEKQDSIRVEIAQHLKEEKAESETPASSVQVINGEEISNLRVAFPTMYDHESVFAGVPVFGKGRIAIALPKQKDAKENQYLTLSLSEYRKFSEALIELHDVKNLGQDSGVPVKDQLDQVTCHYSEESFEALNQEGLEYYEADPEIELKLVGRQCQACQLIVSEDSRKKERIGGKTGKGIAKTKCPKCNEKFGNISLWQIASAANQEQPPA